jgi:nucleoprotein TPR
LLETELQQLRSSSSTSSSEVESLRIRIATLEAANRDTLVVLESKSTANDTLAEELQKQHKKGLELSQQISTLQLSVQNANSAAMSAKFREQSLNQELEQAKRRNEWLDDELKMKSAEALKFRKEKGARIAELQRLNEEANANVDSLKRTELALRNRLDEMQKKAEESLAKVQQLQEATASTEEGFRQELESSRRLAELQAQQTETHKNRLKEVEASLEKMKDDAMEEINGCRQETEVERAERERLESRIAELEAEIDRLEATASALPNAGSVPGTPQQNLNGSLFGRPGSPAQLGTPWSARSKSTITATQAIDELYKVKGQLATERRRNERLSAEMEEMMQGLEAKQPEIEELQAEHERLQQEVVQMSKFVDQTGKERDRAKRDARKAESEAATAQAESNILRQQLRDLSAQIKVLLYDIDARERGLEELSASERSQLERLAKGEIGEEALEGLTDTDRFISQRLTIFRSISELQEKNQELLRITRQLGAQMESEEAIAAKHQAVRDHEQVQALEKKIENYKDELSSMVTRSESYIKERDMFRRMLQHRGQFPPNSDLASMFGQSVDGNGVLTTTEQSTEGKDNVNYASLLRELQSHFDQYREEQTIDRRTLKEQTERLASEKSSLQSEIAKISSQLTLASERYEMLHANYAMLQAENSELQKRSQVLSEAAAKQDLRTQQVAEDLVEAKGLLESMRNEIANLKAEKKLWKEIQDRLNQDNENLMNERSRLNTLLANQQSLLNERELSESETRRRLQMQVEGLETELSATKRKLNDEIEDSKKAQLRREYDTAQNQKRIDDLVASLGSIREELIAAKTIRDHLQARVDELTIELKSAEERVQVLQPRPTPRSGTQITGEGHGDSDQDDTISKEQELAIEVSELKRDLELSRSELENTKSQMEQYKSISQASEEELQSLNESQDQYRQEMDRIIEEKSSQIQQRQLRITDLSAELSAANNELNSLRNQQTELSRQSVEEKAALEDEIIRLRDEDERHATTAQFHQQDLRAQAEIATKAQQDYDHELVKHAEAAKMLQNLRTEYNELRTESASLRAEAESAKVALSQSQSSWEERREQFEQELTELRTRRDDVDAQNRLLLQQLEVVTAQVSALQQGRTTFATSSEAGPLSTGSSDPSVEGLRELVTYLRRDKEIVDVQYELSIQESKRLKQQLDYLQSQLDESRVKLEQERQAHADGSRSMMAHKDLMDKLNELNLFRESSITLRNEARQAQSQLAEKTKEVEELLKAIQPLESRVRELESTKEMQDGEIQLLQEDRDRWQKRNQEILSKYDRIDPAEMEQLKESLGILRAERDSLAADQQPLQEKIQTLETEKAGWQQTRQKLVDQFKDRSRMLTKDKNDRVAERDAAIQEKDALEQQLSSMRLELETAIREKQEVEQKLATLLQELSAAKSEIERGQRSTEQPNPAQALPLPDLNSQQIALLNEQLTTVRQELEKALQEKNQLEQQLRAAREDFEAIRSERNAALASAAQAAAEKTAKALDSATENGVEEGQIDEAAQEKLSDTERKALEEKLAVAEARANEEEAKLKKFQDEMEATLKQRSDKMKTLLNNKLIESRAVAKAALEEEYRTRLEQDKQIWLAEHASSQPLQGNESNTSSNIPPTPGAPAPPTQASIPPDVMNLTDAQVRELIASHATAKDVVMNNIRKRVTIETQKIKEEFEKSSAQKLADAEKKAEEAKVQAVLMEGKKSTVKINMTENRLKVAAAKIQVVEIAAKETPEKPVGQVWEIAKNAKPLPPIAAPAANPSRSIPISLLQII